MSKSIDEGKRYRVGTEDAADDLLMVTPGDVARLMGVSKRQVFHWRAAGLIPPYDFAIGQTKRWWLATIRTWIASRNEKP